MDDHEVDLSSSDDDIVIVRDKGVVPLRDFPHARHDCLQHKHSAASCSGNATHCDQCYCFVCDVSAAQCGYVRSHAALRALQATYFTVSRSAWGDGLGMQDHCNVRNTPYWVNLRTFTRDGVVELPQLSHESQDHSETES